MSFTRSVRAALLVAVALPLAACATAVNHILADPSRYRNRDVTVSGRVVDSASVAGRGAFRIEDRTGSLWVVSDVGVPRRGAHVKVRGRIHDTFDVSIFGGRLNLPGGFSGVVMQASRTRPD
jgi:hypothetical protein